MATFSSSIGASSWNKTVSAAHLARIDAYIKAKYGQNLTDQQVFNHLMADELVGPFKDRLRQWENDTARSAVADAGLVNFS